ncbi:MAG TPA: hypothetical protein GXZ87_07660 [Bacteroidales bacterium]|nr:hypothetical protein [Bacteroidales bacterium]
MKKILFLFTLSVLFISCKSKQPLTVVPIHTETRVIERLVEVQIPPDSAWLTAYLECDSTNKVILRGLNERKSPGVFSDLKLKNGIFNYRLKTQPNPVQVEMKDSLVYKEIPITVEVPKVEYRQTGWQKFTSKVGTITLILLLLIGVWKLIKLKLK